MSKEDMGLDVYLCASGPSLEDVDNNKLHDSGAYIVGVNNSYPHIKPHLWLGMDDPKCFHHKIWSDPCMKVMRGGYANRLYYDTDIKYSHNLFYADCKWYKEEEKENIFKVPDKGERVMFLWTKNIIGITMHILLHMGAKRIHLLGSDLNNTGKQYWNDITRSKEMAKYNQRTYSQIIDFYKWINKTGKKYGVELISCTKGSPINDFLPYKHYQEAIYETKKRRELPKREQLSGPEIEKKGN
tara:strand:+ start:24772 stop:25497 length:726 start_codon:yes stop_codon:yes gene_type:complete